MRSITRRTFITYAGIGALGVGLSGLLSSCGSSGSAGNGTERASSATAASEAAKDQVIVTMTPGSEPAGGFNPLVAWGCGEHVHEPLIQSTLFTTDVDLNFVNDLATSYDSSDDGLTWTFTIRDDVRFTDGEPLTASDVAFTINGIINAEAAEADLTMVDEAVATGDYTVELHLNKPYNALLYTLAVIGIVPEHAYSDDYGDHPIGSGRYMLEQWDKGQQVILVANPDYYGEPPKMKRVVVLFMGEDASLAAAQSGEVDVAYTSAIFAGQRPSGYELLNCKSVDSRGISLPVLPAGSPPKVEEGDMAYGVGNDVTSDLAIRRAMNYGVDRQTIIENVLRGYGTAAYGVSDGMPWSSPAMQCETDVAKAQSLLAEAGWTAGQDGVLTRGSDGQRAEVTLWYSAGDSVRQAIANEFSNQMSELGIKVDVQGASFDDIYPHQYSDPVLWGWGSNSPSELYNLNYSTGWGNFSCYDSQTLDDYMDQALAQPTVEESYPYWQDAQWNGTTGIAPQGEATWVWIANIDHLYFTRDGLHVAKQKPHPHGHGWSLVNNVDQWTWGGDASNGSDQGSSAS